MGAISGGQPQSIVGDSVRGRRGSPHSGAERSARMAAGIQQITAGGMDCALLDVTFGGIL